MEERGWGEGKWGKEDGLGKEDGGRRWGEGGGGWGNKRPPSFYHLTSGRATQWLGNVEQMVVTAVSQIRK
jgi:hypothetical protein